MITVLSYYERISLFHTMLPFLLKNKEKKIFHFTQSANWCLKNDKNKILFIERNFQYREPRDLEESEIDLLKKLRDKYKTIVFFCGQPEAGTNRLDILPFVDRLFYKSIFSDPRDYQKKLYGKNLFADYYHANYGVTDNPVYINKGYISSEDAKRPELSWNIGLGTYPRLNWPQRLGTILARANMPNLGQLIGGKPLSLACLPGSVSHKKIKNNSCSKRVISIHARIPKVTCPSIAYQRTLFNKYISELPNEKKNIFLTGTAPQNQYYKELNLSKMVLSPFGWGEVCFRDFEAIIFGALVIKPDMSHLITWPNVYVPNETYIPIKWDGSDLLEKCEFYLDNENERQKIASNAFEQYKNELSLLKERTDALLGEYYL